jgi:hypothetical protein
MNKLIVFISLFILSCTSKAEIASEVVTKIQSQLLQGSNRVDTRYELTDGDCRIAWQTFSEQKGSSIEIILKNRSECPWTFSQADRLHEKVILRVLNDAKMNLNFELESVEKVFQSKNAKGETVIDDAGSLWWRPIQK